MHGRTRSLFVGLLLTTTSVVAKQPLSFWKPIDSVVGSSNVTSAAIADLNNDDMPDIVLSTPETGTIAVALARGDGGFRGPANYAVSPGHGDLAFGDFNNDGYVDVVVAASGIAVLLGRGDGSFQSPIFSQGSANSVVVADFDRDGKLDIAGIGRNSQSVVPETIDVYPGLGDGTFAAFHTVFTTDSSPRALAVGDFNGDRWPDLVIPVTGFRSVNMYLNQTAFTFAFSGSSFIETGPASTRAVDVDGNGTLDLVTANFLGTVSILLGNGDGTLQAKHDYPLATGCGSSCPSNRWLALADLNGDDLLDVAIATELPGTASILLNDGGGAFSPPDVMHVLAHATFVGTGDFDADGSIDLAVVNSAAGFQEAGTRIVSTFRNKLRPKGEHKTP